MARCFTERFLRLLVLLGELVYKAPICCCPVIPDDVWIRLRFAGVEIKFKLGDEIKMSYTVPADHQDEPFSIDPITGGSDSEGNPIPADDFSISDPVSSDESVVSIVDDPNTPGGKAFHFGAPGAAVVSAQPMYQGSPIGAPITATFTVPHGAPVSIIGGGFNVPGLTPDPVV